MRTFSGSRITVRPTAAVEPRPADARVAFFKHPCMLSVLSYSTRTVFRERRGKRAASGNGVMRGKLRQSILITGRKQSLARPSVGNLRRAPAVGKPVRFSFGDEIHVDVLGLAERVQPLLPKLPPHAAFPHPAKRRRIVVGERIVDPERTRLDS